MRRDFTSYALLGAGKLARHLEFYLNDLGLPFTRWSRGSTLSLEEATASASHILLAVSDSAIAELGHRAPRTRVHFSGALNVSGIFAAHPLMTFGPELHPAEWYRKIPFVIDRGSHFGDLLPGFPNPSFELDPEKRALYHSLVSLAGNSAFLLWRRIGARFARDLGLPTEVLSPFLHQVVDNAALAGDGAFTGPLARGDWGTVDKHLDALEAHPELLNTYKNYLQLAESFGVRLPEAYR